MSKLSQLYYFKINQAAHLGNINILIRYQFSDKNWCSVTKQSQNAQQVLPKTAKQYI